MLHAVIVLLWLSTVSLISVSSTVKSVLFIVIIINHRCYRHFTVIISSIIAFPDSFEYSNSGSADAHAVQLILIPLQKMRMTFIALGEVLLCK